MRTICFVTGNPNKAREAREALKNIVIEPCEIKIAEIQGTPEEIVAHKAKTATQELGKPCFVEDVSLNLPALGGMPGPYVKEFESKIKAEGIWKMLQAFEDKRAEAVSLIGYCVPGEAPEIFKGIVEGEIVVPRGKGWGFDPVFQPKGSKKTYGEMDEKEKSKWSHRGIALRKFAAWLKKEGR